MGWLVCPANLVYNDTSEQRKHCRLSSLKEITCLTLSFSILSYSTNRSAIQSSQEGVLEIPRKNCHLAMTFCDDIADTSCWETSENIDYFTASIQAQYTNPQKKRYRCLSRIWLQKWLIGNISLELKPQTKMVCRIDWYDKAIQRWQSSDFSDNIYAFLCIISSACISYIVLFIPIYLLGFLNHHQ